jgi:DNA-binding CsgD family transcriptional regulator
MRRQRPDALTAREQEVLDLIRRGLTNEEIAQRLGISLDGAKYHVSQILSKLGVATREEAAVVAVGERRRWWAAWPLWAKIAGGATVAATAVGLAVLAWGALRTGGPAKTHVTGEIGTYEDRNSFHSFAEKLAQALEARDVGFFVNNGPKGDSPSESWSPQIIVCSQQTTRILSGNTSRAWPKTNRIHSAARLRDCTPTASLSLN